MDLKVFAELVKKVAATLSGADRFGRYKVYLYPLFDTLQESLPGLSVEIFKESMIQAHRQGHLVLSRADLTPAMDPQAVSASEIAYLNATFHFLTLPE